MCRGTVEGGGLLLKFDGFYIGCYKRMGAIVVLIYFAYHARLSRG